MANSDDMLDMVGYINSYGYIDSYIDTYGLGDLYLVNKTCNGYPLYQQELYYSGEHQNSYVASLSKLVSSITIMTLIFFEVSTISFSKLKDVILHV